jgi:hypothetical protein
MREEYYREEREKIQIHFLATDGAQIDTDKNMDSHFICVYLCPICG